MTKSNDSMTGVSYCQEWVGKPSETDSIKSQISSKTSRGKKDSTKDTIKDIISDSQVNSYFPCRWSPASLRLNIYFYLFLYLYITRITINNDTPHLKSPKNQNRRATLGLIKHIFRHEIRQFRDSRKRKRNIANKLSGRSLVAAVWTQYLHSGWMRGTNDLSFPSSFITVWLRYAPFEFYHISIQKNIVQKYM